MNPVPDLSRSVKGLAVLVTGAASGMGRATAFVFAREGAKVAVTDVKLEPCEAIAAEIRAEGGEAHAWALDVGDADAIARTVPEIAERLGGLDAIVNNAGVTGGAPIDAPNYEAVWERAVPILLTAHPRIIRAALPRVPTGYDDNYQIVQAPGMVSILQEQMHETRVIPLDGRPHLNSSVRQWLGDSRGHWEGDTLVVETTNFSDQATFLGATPNMKLTERFRRADADHLDYRFTVEDPATWTRPWSAAIPWTMTGMLYEYACHEDNYGLYGILAGARVRDQEAAKAKR